MYSYFMRQNSKMHIATENKSVTFYKNLLEAEYQYFL